MRLTCCRPIPTTCREPSGVRPNNGTVRKFRALVFGIALVLLSAGLTSCSSSADDGVSQLESSASPLPERIRPIEIAQTDIAFPAPFDQEWAQGTATRIVTLANGSGEVVAVLGGGDRVVGRDETSSAPEISGAPIVTSSHEINVESVLGVTPDLVLIDASSGPQEAIDSIRSQATVGSRINQLNELRDVSAAI